MTSSESTTIAEPNKRGAIPMPWVLTGLLLLTVGGAALRLWPIFDRPLWFDEACTWDLAVHDSYLAMLRWNMADPHAPLSYLLVRIAIDLFGTTSEWVLRLPSVLAGIACIPAGYVLGRVIHGRGAGLVLAALVAVDPNMVDASQQARMYAMLALAGLLTAALGIRLFRHPQQAGPLAWTLLGLLMGAGLWLNHLALAVLGGMGLAAVVLVVSHARAARSRGESAGAAGAILAGFSAAGLTTLALAHMSFMTALKRSDGVGGNNLGPAAIARDLAVAAADLINLGYAGFLVYLAAGVGLLLLWRRCRTALVVMLALGLASTALIFPFRARHHFMDPRYLTLLQPVVWVGLAMLATGLASVRWRRVGAGLVAVVLVVSLVQSVNIQSYYQHPDRHLIAPLIQKARHSRAAGDAVAYHPMILYRLGEYYQLPASKDMETALYQYWRLRPQPQWPQGSRPPATWLIVGMVNHPLRLAEARQTIAHLADYYGINLDEPQLRRHLAKDHTTLVRISEQGMSLESLSP